VLKLIRLCVLDNKGAFLVGAVFGIINGVLAAYMPLSRACGHYYIGAIVFVHGLLIAYFCYRAYRKLAAITQAPQRVGEEPNNLSAGGER